MRVESVAGGDAELGVDVAEVVLDGAWAEEQPAADLGIGEAVAGQAGALALAGGELGGCGRSAFAGGFAGREEFPAGAFGEGFGSDLGEQVVGSVELFAGVVAAASPAEPFAVQEDRTGEFGADPGPGESVDRFTVERFGRTVVADQRA